MDRPELVQFGDLTPDHFQRHPVWIQCHVVDYDEPWHDDTDEETFRPYVDVLPADPGTGMLLVQADLTLADGTRLEGFVTPVVSSPPPARNDALGYLQPQLFLPSGRRTMFWYGALTAPARTRRELYAELGPPERVFPIRFQARPGLTTGLAEGTIDGFYRTSRSWFRSRLVVDR